MTIKNAQDLAFHKIKKALIPLTVFSTLRIIERIIIAGYINKISVKIVSKVAL